MDSARKCSEMDGDVCDDDSSLKEFFCSCGCGCDEKTPGTEMEMNRMGISKSGRCC